MKRFINNQFYELLRCNSENEITNIDSAYFDFASQILMEDLGGDLVHKYKIVVFSKIEFQKLLKNENTILIALYIKNAIELIEHTIRLIKLQLSCSEQFSNKILSPLNPKPVNKNHILWTASITDLVEFAYAAKENKIFNNGDIEINELVEKLGLLFNIEVRNYYGFYNEIKRRVNRTKFLDEMKIKLLDRMDRTDDEYYNKRK